MWLFVVNVQDTLEAHIGQTEMLIMMDNLGSLELGTPGRIGHCLASHTCVHPSLIWQWSATRGTYCTVWSLARDLAQARTDLADPHAQR